MKKSLLAIAAPALAAIAILTSPHALADSNGQALAKCMIKLVPAPAGQSEGAYEDMVWDLYYSGNYQAHSPIDKCATSVGLGPIYPGMSDAQKSDAIDHGTGIHSSSLGASHRGGSSHYHARRADNDTNGSDDQDQDTGETV